MQKTVGRLADAVWECPIEIVMRLAKTELELLDEIVPGKGDLVVNVKSKEEYDLAWGGKLQFYSAIVGGAIDARFTWPCLPDDSTSARSIPMKKRGFVLVKLL